MIILKVLKIIWIIIKGIFLTYAVLFSLLGTALCVYIAISVTKPIMEVKKLRTENPSETLYMRKYKQEMQKTDSTDSIMHIFIPLDSISPILVRAVLAAEDDGFKIHPGFDIAAIIKAFEYNRSCNRLKHGASTITQQMAKNFFVGGEKKFNRKYIELVYSILMEKYLGKDRILELYLNYAQWGKNIFGCEAASQYYYNKSCKHLTINQAARLAAVLAKPEKLNPHYTKSVFIKKRLRVIGDNLYRRHIINDSMYIFLANTDSLIRINKALTTDSILSDTTKTKPPDNQLKIENQKPSAEDNKDIKG